MGECLVPFLKVLRGKPKVFHEKMKFRNKKPDPLWLIFFQRPPSSCLGDAYDSPSYVNKPNNKKNKRIRERFLEKSVVFFGILCGWSNFGSSLSQKTKRTASRLQKNSCCKVNTNQYDNEYDRAKASPRATAKPVLPGPGFSHDQSMLPAILHQVHGILDGYRDRLALHQTL